MTASSQRKLNPMKVRVAALAFVEIYMSVVIGSKVKS